MQPDHKAPQQQQRRNNSRNHEQTHLFLIFDVVIMLHRPLGHARKMRILADSRPTHDFSNLIQNIFLGVAKK